MTVARGFHADQRRRRKLPIEPLRISQGLHQLLLPSFSRLRIQPTHLLPAGMKITSYNHHLRLLPPQRLWSFNRKTNSGSLEPSLLSNQSKLHLGGDLRLEATPAPRDSIPDDVACPLVRLL